MCLCVCSIISRHKTHIDEFFFSSPAQVQKSVASQIVSEGSNCLPLLLRFF